MMGFQERYAKELIKYYYYPLRQKKSEVFIFIFIKFLYFVKFLGLFMTISYK